MSNANSYKGDFIADFRREACQATAATMIGNGFSGTFDEAFEHAHITDRLQAQALVPDPRPPQLKEIDSRLPAVANIGLGLMAKTPAILDTEGTPLEAFWNTAVSLDSVLTYGSDEDRADRARSTAIIIRGLIGGLGTKQHCQIIEGVLGVDVTNEAAVQLQEKYHVDADAVRPLTAPRH